MCPVNDGIEDTEHFVLLCDSFKEQRCNLLIDVSVVLQNIGRSVWSNSFLQLLLYGESLSYEVNRSILTLTITYHLKTERLDYRFLILPHEIVIFPLISFHSLLYVVTRYVRISCLCCHEVFRFLAPNGIVLVVGYSIL